MYICFMYELRNQIHRWIRSHYFSPPKKFNYQRDIPSVGQTLSRLARLIQTTSHVEVLHQKIYCAVINDMSVSSSINNLQTDKNTSNKKMLIALARQYFHR